jgi:phage head maturation protease
MQPRFTRWGKRKEMAVASPYAELASVESLEANLKTAAPAIAHIQVRHFNRALKRCTASFGARMISGLAIPYDVQTTDLGDGCTELYKPGSFRESVAGDDIRALFCNNPEMVLGRKSAGTLALVEDRAGVHVEIDARKRPELR